MTFKHIATAAAATSFFASSALAVLMHNGLAATPQMGWDNWNAFGCDVSEDLLVETAQRMVDLGMRDAGYEYVVLDDCWSAGRFENGSLRPDTTKFPNGMAHVANRIHDLGLKFGMYSSAGTYTCGQYAGSLGYETIDANTFAGWGVDYLKYDNCFNEGQYGNPNISYARYEKMSNALNATGRQMIYGMCNWGQDETYNWAFQLANSFRVTGDVYDNFNRPDPACPCEEKEGQNCVDTGYHCSIMNIINKVVYFINKSQPGGWNDLDMLEVGNGGMTDAEYRTHMTMWAALRSPLIMGTDIRTLSPESYSIYMNPAILAISQEPTGSTAARIWRKYTSSEDEYGQRGEMQLWAGQLSQGGYVIIFLNTDDCEQRMNATLKDVFIGAGYAGGSQKSTDWDVYDLWGYRMPNSTAQAILNANSTMAASNSSSGNTYSNSTMSSMFLYNATAQSYADGIAKNSSVLMGKRAGTWNAGATWSTTVEPHGVMAYRLMPRSSSMAKRDEL